MRLRPDSPYRNFIKPNVRPSTWIIALLIAIISDAASFLLSLTVFLQIGVDIGTALILLAIFGWSRALIIPLVFEAIPVLSMFPTWTFLVIAMMLSGFSGRNKKYIIYPGHKHETKQRAV